MKLTDEGEYVFLEQNPMGQYLYIEILAGLALTAAVAELSAMHESRSIDAIRGWSSPPLRQLEDAARTICSPLPTTPAIDGI